MVARRTSRLVPRFASLKEYILARTWYQRGAFQFVPGPERDDLEERLRRHGRGRFPLFGPISGCPRYSHEIHIRPTFTHIRPTLTLKRI